MQKTSKSVVLIITACLLVGCGGGSNSTTSVAPSPGSSPTPIPSSTPTAVSGPTLSLSVPQTIGTGQAVTLSLSISAPAGLQSIQVSFMGPGLSLNESIDPTLLGCAVGSTSCNSSQTIPTPLSTGTYAYTISVTDALGRTDSKSGTVVVN